MEIEQPKQPRSGLAIAGLVLGIIALVTSLMPIINNMSFSPRLSGRFSPSWAWLPVCAANARGRALQSLRSP